MQLSVIRTRVSQRLAEGATGPVFYPAAEIDAAINEGLRFFCLFSLALEKTVSFTPAATFTHMLGVFSDWIAPLRVATAAGAIVRMAKLKDLESLDPAWIFASGTASRYIHLGCDLLGVYQFGGALTVTYARAPVALVADADVPEIPGEYHHHLVEYGIYRCRQVEGSQEFAKTLKYWESFQAGASHFANYVLQRNKGSDYDREPLKEFEHK